MSGTLNSTNAPQATEGEMHKGDWGQDGPDPSLASAEAVEKELNTDMRQGLSSAEAARRLEKFGKNELESAPKDPAWKKFLQQFQDPLVYLLLAATVISLPLMYRNAKASFALIPKDLVQAGRTLGLSETKIFWKIILPLSGPGILSGAVLSFARALGEYGATSMLAGNIPGKTATISQRIALVMQDQDYMTAGVWVGVVMLISLFCMTALQLLSKRKEL